MSANDEDAIPERPAGREGPRIPPDLVPELLRLAGVEVPSDASVEVLDIDLEELVPVDCEADAVVTFSTEQQPVWAVAVNLQFHQDEQRKLRWAVDLTGLFRNLRCQVALLVICPDDRGAQWAALPIELGPGSTFRPLVFGVDEVAGLPRPAREHLIALATADPDAKAERRQHLSEFFRHVLRDGNARSIRSFLGRHGVDLPDGLRASATVRGHDQLRTWLH